MPRATIDPTAVEHVDLESVPEGFVKLRKMSYDAYLRRRDMVSQITLGGKEKDATGRLDLQNAKVAVFEFKECIVEHNLEDAEGNLLDFSKPTTFKMLEARVGEEISANIERMNAFLTDEDEQGN